MRSIKRGLTAIAMCGVGWLALNQADITALDQRATTVVTPEALSRTDASSADMTTDEMTLLLAASTDTTTVESTSAAEPTPTTTAAPTTTTTTTTERPRLGSGQPVTFAFGGDVHFEGFLRGRLANETTSFLDPIGDLMADADIAMVNLETAVTDRGVRSPKQFTFRTSPLAYEALADAGVDVVSVANNHGYDFGSDGLADTIESAAEADFPMVGIGYNAAEAYAPWIKEVNGQLIGIIGATQVLDNSLIASWTATDDKEGLASAKEVERLVAEVSALRATVDTVVVYLHWGVEGTTCPAERQQTLADELVAAGADIIVGGHAHRVLGGGRKGEAVVHYGLGNFVFYTGSGPGTTTGVLRVTATGRQIDSYEWVPGRLRSGVANELSGDAAASGLAAWDALRACTDLEP